MLEDIAVCSAVCSVQCSVQLILCSGLYSLQCEIQCAVNIVHLKGGGIAGYEVVQCSEGCIR